MTHTEKEIPDCEEQIRLADASPEPDTSHILDALLSDDVILIGPQGQTVAKSFVLEAHRPPGKRPFDAVSVTELVIKDLGSAAVVSCRVEYKADGRTFSLRSTRVWHRVNRKWKVVLGTVTGITPV